MWLGVGPESTTFPPDMVLSFLTRGGGSGAQSVTLPAPLGLVLTLPDLDFGFAFPLFLHSVSILDFLSFSSLVSFATCLFVFSSWPISPFPVPPTFVAFSWLPPGRLITLVTLEFSVISSLVLKVYE